MDDRETYQHFVTIQENINNLNEGIETLQRKIDILLHDIQKVTKSTEKPKINEDIKEIIKGRIQIKDKTSTVGDLDG